MPLKKLSPLKMEISGAGYKLTSKQKLPLSSVCFTWGLTFSGP